jgi:hypothetical protein
MMLCLNFLFEINKFKLICIKIAMAKANDDISAQLTPGSSEADEGVKCLENQADQAKIGDRPYNLIFYDDFVSTKPVVHKQALYHVFTTLTRMENSSFYSIAF